MSNKSEMAKTKKECTYRRSVRTICLKSKKTLMGWGSQMKSPPFTLILMMK